MVKQESKRKVLGLDLGSNSIGWALLEEENGTPNKIIDLGVRVFPKAVEEKTPTPKNQKRRNKRLARRVIQRRARRKMRLLRYLISLELLPKELLDHDQPEIILNGLGDPYSLRAKALDKPLSKFELGRVLLHLVQRRGFLSNKKITLGDMIDDPDVQEVLEEFEKEEDTSSDRAKEETAFKKDISLLKEKITSNKCRTLGEYLATIDSSHCRRNRFHDGGHLRTDRQMYRDELDLIWEQQTEHHNVLSEKVKGEIESIIFYQRPLKLRADRIGRCSLEPSRKRSKIARLEYQRFRYHQDINNLNYIDPYSDTIKQLTDEDRERLIEFFEVTPSITFPKIKKLLGLDRGIEFNLEEGGNKKLKGNITACTVREVLPDWDALNYDKQIELVEDLTTIQKKSVLKKRLIEHWCFTPTIAVNLCMLEFEPGHGNLSLKAINLLLPYLIKGYLYSDARQAAGYGYDEEEIAIAERLQRPPETTNPIVNKGLHELRRVVNALIAEYGRPDAIRIEMARDLEMNTKRYKARMKQQRENTKANDRAIDTYQGIAQKNSQLGLSRYPSRNDKIRFRLWEDQDHLCAYSCKSINLTTLFSAEIEVDHILPLSESLDDSYMNKVVCFASENRQKEQRTPIDAFGNNTKKWEQISQALSRWNKKLNSKKNRFYMKKADVQKRDFINSQLNDTRYISRVALEYLSSICSDISTSKGVTTSWLRHQWGLNSLIGESDKKERTDHRHHAIDAVVVATVDRRLYKTLVGSAKEIEGSQTGITMNDLYLDPPWSSIRSDLEQQLEGVIVSHCPLTKISGALHKETGVGFIKGKGCVYRIPLNTEFKNTHASKIIDNSVREIVINHMNQYNGDSKAAFADGVSVFHKDEKTPIKRVRILQSATSLSKLKQSKFGVRNQQGEVFKWHAYGNTHHVEIIKNNKNGRVKGQFVTMMEAAQRARGIGTEKQPIIQTKHGDDIEFLMALHINDLVSIEEDDECKYFRVQKLEGDGNQISLRLNTASTISNDTEKRRLTIHKPLITEKKLHKIRLNVIGKIIN